MSITRKLTLILAATCAIPVVVICGVLICFEFKGERDAEVEELRTLAAITGWNSSAAAVLHDARSAERLLQGLQLEPHVLDACLHDRNQRLVAAYRARGSAFGCPERAPAPGVFFEGNTVLVAESVFPDAGHIGTVSVRSDLTRVDSRVKEYLFLLPWLLLVSIAMTLLISSRLQKVITDPIQQLAEVALQVSARKDYSLRAPAGGNDEVGLLVAAFNDMLARIGQHAAELNRMNREMAIAKQSAERTAEALAASEMRFHSTFDEGPLGMVIVDGEGRILEANRSLHGMLGYSRNELRGRQVLDLTHPADQPATESRVRDLIAGTVNRFQIEKRYLMKRGNILWTRLTVSRSQGVIGEPLTVGMVEDISDRKRLEEQFHQSQKMEAVGRLAGGLPTISTTC